jgi:hypothetical protein
VVAVPFGGESSVAQQALGEQLLVAGVTSSSMNVSMRARFSCWQIGLGRSSNGNSGMGGELVSQIAQTDYALFRHAEATSRERQGRSAGECRVYRTGCKGVGREMQKQESVALPFKPCTRVGGTLPVVWRWPLTCSQSSAAGRPAANSKAAATITTSMTDFTATVNQMDATRRVPLQSAALSHTQCESSRVWWCPPWRVPSS